MNCAHMLSTREYTGEYLIATCSSCGQRSIAARCAATTRRGTQCKYAAVYRTFLCGTHTAELTMAEDG